MKDRNKLYAHELINPKSIISRKKQNNQVPLKYPLFIYSFDKYLKKNIFDLYSTHNEDIIQSMYNICKST